jgi:Mg-chelatase subunit ChlD
MKASLPLALAAGLFGLATLAACAPDTSTDGSGGGGTGANGSGAGSNAGGGDTNSTSTGFETSTTSTGVNECASETIEAELAPLTMFITFDKSGSMGQDNKWNQATNALKAFFADPEAAGLEVALRFFPEGQCDGNSCNVNACATPNVDVGMLTADPAPTDTHESILTLAINAMSPNGNTPMSAALEGALQWGANYLVSNPDHKVVAILVTDGEPVGCEESTQAIANIAASGAADGVPTYTVGLQGSNQNQLTTIATAGGGQAFFIGSAGDTQAQLLAALQAIRGEQLACELDIPEPTEGTFNKALVNVEYTPGGSTQGQTIGKVGSEGGCGAKGGWYYDDEANPTTIILCPTTCDTVREDDSGKISVVLGCDTIPA